MANKDPTQIIRHDARNCFLEVKSDSFYFGKIHVGFVRYDLSRPEGQRYVNCIHIYISVDEFLALAHDVLSGALHEKTRQLKEQGRVMPVYEVLGGTPAEKLAQQNKSREDGKSESRATKLFPGKKMDYLWVAESGAGEIGPTGLIIPKYGKEPDQQVSIPMNERDLNRIMLIAKTHFEAWLTAQYIACDQTEMH